MAKRSTRQLIKDRLDSACKHLDQADTKLAEVQAMYLDAGEERGEALFPLRDLLMQNRELIRRFRYERT